MTHLATPQGGYGYQDFGIPYWAATGGAGAHSNSGSAPPSARAHMELFGLPFTPTEASPATATFPYGSTLDGNMVGGGSGMGQNGGGGGGYEQYLALGGQHHLQTAADIYATGQDTRHVGGFGLTAPPPPRGRGGYRGQHQQPQQPQNHHQHQQVQNQQHHQQQSQNQNHQIGWAPHDALDGGMANLGTGRLADPATNSYYGLGGHGYGVNQGMYGMQTPNDRRKSVSRPFPFLPSFLPSMGPERSVTDMNTESRIRTTRTT